MATTNPHISSVNKMMLNTLTTIILAATLGNAISVMNGEKTTLVATLAFAIGALTLIRLYFCYRKDKAHASIKREAFWLFLGYYIFTIFTTETILVFIYIMPVFYMYTLYYDIKTAKIFAIVVLIINAMRIFWMVSFLHYTESSQINQFTIQGLSMIVVCYNSIIATKLMTKFNKDSISSVEASRQNQEVILGEVLEIGSKLDAHSNDIFSIVTNLQTSTESMNNSMQQATSGVESISRNIEQQSTLTEDIQSSITDTANSAKSMVAISHDTIKKMDEGSSMVKTLSNNTDQMNTNSKQVQENILSLQEKTRQINAITNSITALAHKTNILSLNASIESARAGEAGQGFAVVAKEIGSLASQTTSSAATIEQIILELEKLVEETSISMEDFSATNQHQNQLIQSTENIFNETIKQMDNVNEMVETVVNKIDTILSANNDLVVSIQHISASSEHAIQNLVATAASSQSNLKQVEETKKIADDLLDASNHLKIYM